MARDSINSEHPHAEPASIVGISCGGSRVPATGYKEFQEARDEEPPSWRPDPPGPDLSDRPAWRHPLTPELREQLLTTFALLVAAGILDPDEVPDDGIVECAEHMDVFEDMDIYSVMRVLEMLGDERDPPLRHLAFFTTHTEFYEDDAFGIVREFARISGYDGPLRQIRCDMTGDWQSPSLDPVPNAVLEFEMGTVRYSLPFTTYAKYLPAGLIEQLAPIFAPSGKGGTFLCLVGRRRSGHHICNLGADRGVQRRAWAGTVLGADLMGVSTRRYA